VQRIAHGILELREVFVDFVFNGRSFNLEPETFDRIKFWTVGGS